MSEFLILLLLLLLLNINISSSTNQIILLGGLYPITGRISSGSQRSMAAYLAVNEINNDIHNDFPGKTFNLSLNIEDTNTQPFIGFKKAIEMVTGSKNGENICVNNSLVVRALTGAASSSVSIAVTHASTLMNIPQVSYSSTSPSLSDKTLYKLFCRVVPSDTGQTIVLFKLLEFYSWRRVSVLFTPGAYGTGLADEFFALAGTIQPSIDIRVLRSFTPEKQNVLAALDSIKASGSRIVLVFAVVGDVRTLLLEAYNSKLIGSTSGYSWISVDGWTTPDLWTSNVLTSSEVSILKTISTGIIGTKPPELSSTLYTNFLQRWENNRILLEQKAGVTSGSFNLPLNQYTPFAYEAVYTLAKAFYQLNGNISNGTLVVETISKLNYEGITGQVSFDSNCDRQPNFDVANFQNGKVISALSFIDDKLVPYDNIDVIFADGTTNIPGDTPPLEIIEVSTILQVTCILLCTAMFLALIVCIILLYRFRKSRFVRGSGVNTWIAIFSGIFLSTLTVFLLFFEYNDALYRCHFVSLLLNESASLVWGALLIRTVRLFLIFGKHRQYTTYFNSLSIQSVMLILNLLLFLIWYLIHPANLKREIAFGSSTHDIEVCHYDGYITYKVISTMLPNIILFTIVAILSLKIWNIGNPNRAAELKSNTTDKTKDSNINITAKFNVKFHHFNESRGILQTQAMVGLLLVLSLSLTNAFSRNITIDLVTSLVSVLLSNVIVVSVLFLPLIYKSLQFTPDSPQSATKSLPVRRRHSIDPKALGRRRNTDKNTDKNTDDVIRQRAKTFNNGSVHNENGNNGISEPTNVEIVELELPEISEKRSY